MTTRRVGGSVPYTLPSLSRLPRGPRPDPSRPSSVPGHRWSTRVRVELTDHPRRHVHRDPSVVPGVGHQLRTLEEEVEVESRVLQGLDVPNDVDTRPARSLRSHCVCIRVGGGHGTTGSPSATSRATHSSGRTCGPTVPGPTTSGRRPRPTGCGLTPSWPSESRGSGRWTSDLGSAPLCAGTPWMSDPARTRRRTGGRTSGVSVTTTSDVSATSQTWTPSSLLHSSTLFDTGTTVAGPSRAPGTVGSPWSSYRVPVPVTTQEFAVG